MRGRWAAPLLAVTLAVPVATAQAHPADWMYTPGGEYARRSAIRTTASACSCSARPHAGLVQRSAAGTSQRGQGRGMNAAIAVHGDYVYVGSRTDGKNNNAIHAGVLVVDVARSGAPVGRRHDGPALRGQPGRVLARAARLALAEPADRPAHQLRRHRRAPVPGAEHRQPRSASTTSPATTRANPKLLYTRTRSTRTSSTSGRTRRTPSAR